MELFREAAKSLGLTEGTSYVWSCQPSFKGMIEDLKSPAGVGPCDAAIAGITITTARQESGIKFSYPYYSSSLRILVAAGTGSASGWGRVFFLSA